nr:tetratricopeptide repeat protein [[Clostridium] hylemonae]
MLAQSYEKKGDQDKANIEYQKIIEDYPNTEAAASAQEAGCTESRRG